MHAAVSHHGGDLNSDTVTMVGGALDFQVRIIISSDQSPFLTEYIGENCQGCNDKDRSK